MPVIDEVSVRTRILWMIAFIALVVGFVAVIHRPDWKRLPITDVTGSVDSNQLAVAVGYGWCDSGGPRVREIQGDGYTVVIRADQNVRGNCHSNYLTKVVTVELDDVLDNRRIILQDRRPDTTCRIAGAATPPCR